jgi:hypothetical protein
MVDPIRWKRIRSHLVTNGAAELHLFFVCAFEKTVGDEEKRIGGTAAVVSIENFSGICDGRLA